MGNEEKKDQKPQCKNCGAEFEKYHHGQKFCSYKCSAEWSRKTGPETHKKLCAERKARLEFLEKEVVRLKTEYDNMYAQLHNQTEFDVSDFTKKIEELEATNKELADKLAAAEKAKADVETENIVLRKNLEAKARPDLEPGSPQVRVANRTVATTKNNAGEDTWCKRLGKYITCASDCGLHDECRIPHVCPDAAAGRKARKSA